MCLATRTSCCEPCTTNSIMTRLCTAYEDVAETAAVDACRWVRYRLWLCTMYIFSLRVYRHTYTQWEKGSLCYSLQNFWISGVPQQNSLCFSFSLSSFDGYLWACVSNLYVDVCLCNSSGAIFVWRVRVPELDSMCTWICGRVRHSAIQTDTKEPRVLRSW